ncbi:MAG: outer membrane beta-barrel protein, partial [Pseudomonadota bacterium]
MKKTLMCATAAAALASAGLVAQAEEGWYGRADIGYGFDGTLDHDPENSVIGSLGGDSETDSTTMLGLGLGYGYANGLRLELGLSNRSGDLEPGSAPNGIPADDANFTYSAAADGYLQSWDLMLNGIYDFNRDGTIQPYIGIGAGAA